jgi:phosphoglycerate dehydrogenase-like enzyme
VITLPHTPATEHLFDTQAFQAMNPAAILFNVGRGKVVSEPVLIQAVQQQQIRGAVLDVFEEEPLAQSSHLWGLPNVFLTPHNSAYSFPEEIVKIFVENYQRYITGKPLRYLIDFEKGY